VENNVSSLKLPVVLNIDQGISSKSTTVGHSEESELTEMVAKTTRIISCDTSSLKAKHSSNPRARWGEPEVKRTNRPKESCRVWLTFMVALQGYWRVH